MPRRQVVAEALKSCRSVLIGVGLVSLVINLLMLTGPMFMLQVYDRVLTSRSIPTLLALAGIAIGLYVFFGVLDGLRARILTRVGARIDRRLSSLTFDRSITLPLMGKQQNTRLEPVRDLDAVRQFMSGPGPSAFFDMPWMPLYIAVVFFFHPVLGFLALGGAFIMCVLIALNEMMASKPVGAAAAQSMKRNALVEGSRRNAEAIVAMGMVSGLRERWVRENESFLNLQGTAADRVAGFSSGIKMFRFILQSSVLGVGAFLAVGELISPGMMIAASIITARAVAPIEQAVTQWRSFIGARLALKRLRLVLDGQDDQTPETELPLPTQSLEVEGIFVGAPGERTAIVEGVSFKMRAGEALAIIGPSGSGKSTLGRAIVGVWSTLRGDIRLDGADLDQWDPDKLGQAVGYLPQDVQLFQGTVAENIARFRPDWTSEDVIKAAQLANAHELITNLSDGYDTQIGEGGMALSGGQRQRIALARALYGDPFLIVLDEPNSNLDAEGEGALTQAIKTMRAQNCIVIVIAHRPSALQAVETVLYLNDGRAGAYGPRDEVLKKVLSGGPSRAGKDLKVVGDT